MEETTHARTVALLPWHLNGTLDSGERRQVEEHLESCADCRGELAETRGAFALYGAHLPATLLVQRAEAPAARLYGVGGLPVERRLVDAHLDHCGSCREELDLVRQSLQSFRHETGDQDDALAPVTPFARPVKEVGTEDLSTTEDYGTSRWLPMALAASLLVAVISAGGWGFTAQQADARADDQRQEIAELQERLQDLERRQRTAQDVGEATNAETGDDGAALADLRRQMDSELRDLEERNAQAEGRAEALDRQVAELRGGVPAAGVVYVPLEGGDVLRSTASAGDGSGPRIELDGAGGVLLQPAVRPDLLAAGGLAYRVSRADGVVVAEGPLPVVDESDQGLGRYVSVYLPASRMVSGSLVLELRSGGEEIGRYPFRVER